MKLAANLIKDLKDRWAQIMLIVTLILLGVQVLPVIRISAAVWIVTSVFVVYLLGRLVFSVGEVRQDEAQVGQWIGSKFLYHTPRHVFTKQIQSDDLGKKFWFPIIDSEPKTLVTLRVEKHGGLIHVGLISPFGFEKSGALHGENGTVLINENREAGIIVKVAPPNSDPTTVRVYMLSWEWV